LGAVKPPDKYGKETDLIALRTQEEIEKSFAAPKYKAPVFLRENAKAARENAAKIRESRAYCDYS